MTKVSENNSVIPQDRIGISYNLLNDVELRSGFGGFVPGDDQEISEFKFRYEKTFFDGNFSVDLIMPFNITNERDQSFNSLNGLMLDRESELGDLAINLKALLHRTDRFALSAGLMLEIPTSDPQQILIPIGPGIGLQFANEDSYFLTPWIGGLYDLNDKTFVQSFMSYRMETNRHDVNFLIGPAAFQIGDAQDPNYFMWSTQIGHRMYENRSRRGITAIIPSLELHYTSSTDTDPTASFQTPIIPIAIPPSIGSVDYLTLTLATNIELGRKASLGMGFGLPLREGNSTFPLLSSGPTDKNFDWSFNMNFNYYFGS